ncbi:hypothetical protein [Streptomyces albogriseolus]|uniref:hypothetical protein n=1 Tax=Streptomyces albogriseolus TaxID=1887 RepID=UPI00345F1BDC
MKYAYDCPKCHKTVSVFYRNGKVEAEALRPCGLTVLGLRLAACPLTRLLPAITQLGDPALITNTLERLAGEPDADEVETLREQKERLSHHTARLFVAAEDMYEGYNKIEAALRSVERAREELRGYLRRYGSTQAEQPARPVHQPSRSLSQPVQPLDTQRHFQPQPSQYTPPMPGGSILAETFPRTPAEIERAREFREGLRRHPPESRP